jgi:hypothetical protein
MSIFPDLIDSGWSQVFSHSTEFMQRPIVDAIGVASSNINEMIIGCELLQQI